MMTSSCESGDVDLTRVSEKPIDAPQTVLFLLSRFSTYKQLSLGQLESYPLCISDFI